MICKPGEAMKNTNDAFSVLSRMHRGLVVATFITLLLALSVAGLKAQTYTISVENSSLQVNLASGLTGWTFEGQNDLDTQWLYYSLGGSPIESINTLSAPSTPIFTGLSFGGTILSTNLGVTYGNSALSVTTKYDLQVQGSGSAVSTTITIANTSATTESLNFYQYSDFVLGGMTGGQSVQFVPGATNYAMIQTGNGVTLNGQVNVPGVTVGEVAGLYDGTQFGLENGNTAPNFNSSVLSASGSNVDFGYEFEATLAPTSSFVISEIQIVPEPTSVALVSVGLLGLLGGRRLGCFKKR